MVSTAAVVLASVAYFAASGVSFPVLPELVKESSGGGNTAIGLAFSMLGLGMLVGRPFVGFLNDRFGRRRMVVLGAALGALLQSIYVPAADLGLTWLLLARFLVGLCGSVMYVGMATIATEMSSPQRRAQVFSWFAAAVFLGFAIGPLVGETVLNAAGFSWAYVSASGFMLITLVCGLVLPETTPPDVNPKLGRITDIFESVGMRVGGASFVAVLSFMGLQGFIKQWGLELGVENVGLILAAYAGTALLIRVFAARLMDANRRGVGTLAYLSLAVASVILATAGGAPSLYLGAVVLAIGSAFVTPLLILIATDSTPASARARVMATVTFANDMGASIGVPLLGVVADAAGFQIMYLTLAVAALLALAYFRSPMISSLAGA